MRIRTLIVDDEPLGRERIRSLLEGDPEIEIAGECGSGLEALEAIEQAKPDLVFLDVQMPEMDGFEVLSALESEQMPVVIFVTAYDKYAVRAFEVHALDYLLKSFDRDRFEAALRRAKSEIAQRQGTRIDPRLTALLDDLQRQKKILIRLVVRSGGRISFLRAEEIDWIEAADNYALLHAGRDKHLVRETMSSLADRLDPEKFQRIHRSTIVNLDRVRELEPLFHGDYLVRLRDGTELTLSRNYREKLERPLGRPL
ncbi:MAG: LytR/AlgR family response regulator transcription factor [Candidatus Acidiferrales bacterium]